MTMTVEQMEKVNYLNRAFHLKNKINALQSIKDSNKYLSAMTYDSDGSMNGKNENSTENKMFKSLELSEKIDVEIEKLNTIVSEIYDIISHVEDDEFNAILTYRYLNYKSMEQIAELMNYSVRSTYYKHKKALEKVCIVLQ